MHTSRERRAIVLNNPSFYPVSRLPVKSDVPVDVARRRRAKSSGEEEAL